MAVTAGLALGILATFAAATPVIAETTDTATPTTISAANTGDILTPDANGDVTYTNDNGATTKVSIVISGNGFTVPKASLPTKEGYHIKAFRTDKYNQDVPVNFTTDGNAILSLAELTHTRIMADGATHYSRTDTWFNAITPVFEADETEPTPTPTPEPEPTPEPNRPVTPTEDSSHETPAPAQTQEVTKNDSITKNETNVTTKKSVLPNTGDTATVSSVLGTIGTILVALGIRKKKK